VIRRLIWLIHLIDYTAIYLCWPQEEIEKGSEELGKDDKENPPEFLRPLKICIHETIDQKHDPDNIQGKTI
jgi:hypothetical protein